MSIWVQFAYDGCNREEIENGAAVSEQAIAFIWLDTDIMEQRDVYASFIEEYVEHCNESSRPRNVIEWLQGLSPWHSKGDIYWIEGSQPFAPEILLKWTTRWRQLLDFASPEELDELLQGTTDERNVTYYNTALDNFQQFAEKAMSERKLIKMYIV